MQQAPDTPAHIQLDEPVEFKSPGAASEMSGTTAMSSFSMVEAEFLESKFLLKHMRKLCDSSREFLDHLAPPNGTMHSDMRNIHEIQKPDSDFTEEYRDFNDELNVHLKHYKNEEHSYIHVRAIHCALFGANRDGAASRSGLDIILYLANLLIFAKQMIHSDRNDKDVWNALRQLDNSFPGQFMRSLEAGIKPTTAGDSAMLKATFDLALDLRTQLAISVLERSSNDADFNPDEVIREVFLRAEPSQDAETSIIRGWSIEALGGEESALPQQFETFVVERLNTMRQFFPLDDESLARGEVIDLETLCANFPWQPTILRLLHWVRLRHEELSMSIDELGGAAAILRNVKAQIEQPQAIAEKAQASSMQSHSPRQKRTSFAQDRRRSGRKFDPNAPVDLRAIDVLKARERRSEANSARQDQGEALTVSAAQELSEDERIIEESEDDYQPVVSVEEEERPDEHGVMVGQDLLGDEELEEEAEEAVEQEAEEEMIDAAPETVSAKPPPSSAALLKALKEVSKPGKENRTISIFDRQKNAERVEFGDGFDTQPTPGATQNKGKQRAQSSPNRKRPRPVEVESESEDDTFETEDRTARVHERRRKLPVAKKVRIDPGSSAAPPSHQPPSRQAVEDEDVSRREQDESVSENEAPEMTEEVPLSTYQAQKVLAKQNMAMPPKKPEKERKARTGWTTEEEDAFAEYMAIPGMGARYAAILRHDDTENGYKILQTRTQVNLKDKARTMAINMIRSGTGLLTGFDGIVKPDSKHGKALRAQGYTW
ncbi:hypothetical protein BDU57DRAFT_30166 [Ampelomyces quisqualis]|uniref:Myb-like domain-containing protein n=1 Tax=Ampelomyces quisqualis TaxID=50730 RepID=A0A6A5R2C3_AMPQU|nr:hypothetical protein BDU57DRAFT_30166 [Ampelomyces quisqualis]